MSDRSRIRAGAVALALAPSLVLAAHLVQATPQQHDTASELAVIAAHPTRYQLAGFLSFAAMLLFVPAFLSMARPLWAGRPRLALTGVSMSLAGLLALVALTGSGPVSLAMTQGSAGSRASMVAVTDRYESSVLVGVWVLVMIVGYSIGPVVLGVGLWRSGLPVAVPLLLLAGLVLAVLDAGRWPLAAGFALTASGMALVAVRTWPRATTKPARTVAAQPQGLSV
jgi:hypothetical protein